MKVLPIANIKLDGLCQLNPKRYPFLLQSVSQNQHNRFSILFAHPLEKIILNDIEDFDFLNKLQAQVNKMTATHSELPFSGGWFVYLSYELIGQIESKVKSSLHFGEQPIAIAIKIPTAIVVDHQQQKTYLLDQFSDEIRLNQVLADIQKLDDIDIIIPSFNGELNTDAESKFINGVGRCHNYIQAGDVFQVNLSRQWQYQLTKNIDAVGIYQALKTTNPAPFSALAQFADFSIISSSPERLFSVNGFDIQTRPIAGTHPRGQGEDDKYMQQRLINHPKEQAEHIMLLDMQRHDLGKVCVAGSVNVNEMMSLETYPYVHHIVSNIKGKLRQNIGIKALISALFPGGTITGCPKIRCMQIIAELEQCPRQAYTGSLGYISSNGKMDFNILIRTLTKQNNNLILRTGAGIVFDSIAQRELAETQHKAQGILKIFC